MRSRRPLDWAGTRPSLDLVLQNQAPRIAGPPFRGSRVDAQEVIGFCASIICQKKKKKRPKSYGETLKKRRFPVSYPLGAFWVAIDKNL